MMWFITRSPLREKTSLPLLAGGGQEGGVHRHAHTLHDTPTESLRANALTLRLPRKRGSGFFALLLCGLLSLTACTLDKLENMGKPPAMAAVENPVTKPDYQPLTWPMPPATAEEDQYANSLWQPGARAFFRDQRASRVGDIVRVKVSIKDKAEVDNETKSERKNDEEIDATSIFGFQRELFNWLPGRQDPASLLEVSNNTKAKGKGEMSREEKIQTQIAAVVTQVLPNGNLVIDGRQEMRVNFEVRELGVRGIIRPEDIDADNTIESSKIAEARIAYGGRGQLSAIQQPRWGSNVIDILSPF